MGAASTEMRPDRLGSTTEQLGDVVDVEVLHDDQDDHLELPRGQRGDRFPDLLGRLGDLDESAALPSKTGERAGFTHQPTNRGTERLVTTRRTQSSGRS